MPRSLRRRPSTDALAAAFNIAVAELFDACSSDPSIVTVDTSTLVNALANAAPSVTEPYTQAVLALLIADPDAAAAAFELFSGSSGDDDAGKIDQYQFTFAFHVGFGLLNAEAHVEALARRCGATLTGVSHESLDVDAVLTELRSSSTLDPIAALWIEVPEAATRAAVRELFFDVSGIKGVDGDGKFVDAVCRNFIFNYIV